VKYVRLADVATLGSLAAAIGAILLAMQSNPSGAALFLLASTLLDFLDGRIARLMNQGSDFGLYADSLVDIIAFGAAPVMIAFVLLPITPVLVTTAIIYLAAGVYRLARFQVTRLKNQFQGVPITTNGIAFAAVLLFVPDLSFTWVMPAYFLLSSALMVSTFSVRKL
jgi:CDP-diacylglycerol---serine O-phosphatidyltransferase